MINQLQRLNVYCSLILLLLGLSSSVIGQDTLTIGTATTASTTYGPIYRSSAASSFDYSRNSYLLTNSDLGSLPGGAIIQGIAWEKATVDSIALAADTSAFFKIYLDNNSNSILSSTPWSTLASNGTLVVDTAFDTINNLAGSGWKYFDLNTPFEYSGSSIQVSVDWDCSFITGNPTSGSFTWRYTGGNTGKTIYANSGSAITTVGTVSALRPNIRFIYTLPSCPGPVSLSATGISSSGATLAWTESGTSTSWQIEYDTAGFSLGTGTNSIVTSNSSALSGLAASTSYEFYVRSICGAGDSSVWAGPFTFTTLCNAFVAPYLENFDGLALVTPYTDLPACWEPQVGPDFWDVTNDVVNTGHSYLPNIGDHTTGSANYMWIDASSDILANAMETPMIDMSGLTTPYAGFWFASNNVDNAINHTIALDAWDGSAWVTIATEIGNFSSWVQVAAVVPSSIPTTTKFRIHAIANPNSTASDYYFNDLGVDDFFVNEAPTCPTPTSPSAFNINPTSFTLAFTEVGTATSWQIELDSNGAFQSFITVTNDTNILTGYMPNTSYTWRLRAICGAGDTSSWSSTNTFNTPCNAYTIPYFEGFESGYTHNSLVEGCLTQASEVGTNSWTANNTLTDYNRSPYAGAWNAFLRYSNTDWIFIPVDLTSGTSYTAEFYARQDGATAANSDIMVAFGSTNTIVGMTDTIVAPTGIINGNYQLITGTFTPSSSGVYYVGIRGFMNGSPWYISLDNMAIFPTPNCPPPSALAAASVAANGATLTWTENGSAASWQIEYDTAGFTQGTGMTSVVTSNPAAISGLTFETNYDFYVRAICGVGDTSAWSGVGSFFTGYCTASPSSVDGSGITNVSMDTINNTTGTEPGNYGNYTSMIAVAGQGGTLPISITLATGYDYDMWAWVDWNDDLDFSDPGEEYFLGTSSSANPTVFTSSITIPSNAALGNHRIRIGGADSGLGTTSPADPCYTGSWGSFEDYTLNIVPLEQIDLTITWDEISTVDYTTVAFEGGLSAADLDPMNSANNVLRFVKPSGAMPWAGVTLSTTAGLANPIPFTASATTVSAKIYSPAAGVTVMMKTEVVGSPTIFVEASANTTVANGWQTLVFDFGAPSNGSLNLANNYELLSFFPDFLSAAAGDTFYVDSVYFGGVVPTKDASITSFTVSGANTCSSEDTIMVVIENFGNTSISNFDIIGNQNGGQNDTLTYSNTIAAGGVDTLFFPVVLVPGANTFNAYTFLTEDADVTNDSNSTSIFYSEVSTTASAIDVACPESTDGLAAVTVDSGGVAPFTYMWNDANMTTTNTIQNLAPGTYAVTTTDANGCEFVDSVSIIALNGTPSVSITGNDTICGDGSSTLDAGAGFDAYAWGSGATTQTINVTSTATYMVTITDTNGCVNDASFDVFAYDLITLTTSGVDVTCEGGSDGVVAATATGGTTAFNYEWSDGAQVSSNIDVEAGTYFVTVDDGSGCIVVDSITIGFMFNNPTFSFTQANVAGEASVVVNAGGSFSDYDWSNGANTAEVTFTTSGTYTLTVTDTNGCSTSDVINVEIWPLGVNQVEATTMSVYPNPSTGIFNLTLGNVPADQVELVVLNVNGQVVTTTTAAASNGIITDVIDLGNAASGIYFLQVNINGSVSTLRLNVQ